MIDTPRGGRIYVERSPEHLGDGVLMICSMKDPDDRRRVEIYLSPENQLELVRELMNKHLPSGGNT